MVWKPKKSKEKYLKKAKEVVETFEKTKHDLEKTAQAHWFHDVRSVYRYLKLAGYKLPPRERDDHGRYLPSKKLKN